MFTNAKFRITSAVLTATIAAAIAAGVATASAAPKPSPASFVFVHHYDKASPVLQ